jgi:hypothetical protein
MEKAIEALEQKFGLLQLPQGDEGRLDALAADLKTFKETQNLVIENLKLKVELLEEKVKDLTA